MKPNACLWTEDEDGNWQTACGRAFHLEYDTPLENKFQFCCYCGKPLAEQRYKEKLNQGADHTPSVFNSGEPNAGATAYR